MAGKKGSYETNIKISGELAPSFSASIKRAELELSELFGYSRKQSAGMLAGINGLDKIADKTFSTVVKSVKMAAIGTAGIVSSATFVGADYEAQMSAVQAIADASSYDMMRLDELAQKMGRDTKFSATEAGQGLEFMAQAGWRTDQMISGLPGIMNLAASSSIELGEASNIVTNALTAFGMTADEAGHFSDVLAQAASSSNTDVSMMGATFEKVAPVAGALGYSIDDMSLGIGLMANNSVKAEVAGTSLKTALANMADPSKQQAAAMKKYGLSLTGANGEMKTFKEVLVDMRYGLGSLSKVEQTAAASTIFGQESFAGMLAIVNTSEKDFNQLSEAIDNSAGAAERMSKQRLDNLAGDLTLLKSSAEGAGVALYSGLSDTMREIVQGVTGSINSFTESEALENLAEYMPTIRREAKQFGSAVGKAFEPLLGAGEWFLEHPDVLAGSLSGIGSALLTFKAVKGVTSLVKSLGSLSGMVGAWPVLAAGAVVGGVIGIGTAMETAADNAARANLKEHFGEITLSIDELNQAARHLLGDGLFDNIDAMGEVSVTLKNLHSSMDEGLREIQKENWKLSLGIEFDEDDRESYKATVESYVKNAQEYITNSGYELKMAVDIVFGDNPDKEGINAGNDTFYQSLLTDVQTMYDGLQGELDGIVENGFVIDGENKQEIVNNYLKDIAEITEMISDAENAAKMQMIQVQFAGADLDPETFQNLQQSINEYREEANKGIDASQEKIFANLNSQRAAGQKGREGGISEEEFKVQSDEAIENYYARKAEVIQNGYQAMKDTIMATYGDEIGPALDAVNREIQEGLPELMKTYTSPEQFGTDLDYLITNAMESTELSGSTKDAIATLLKGMIPVEEDLADLKGQMGRLGLAIPEGINDTLGDLGAMKAVTGDVGGMWSVIGEQLANNEDYAVMATAINSLSALIPEGAIEAIESKNAAAEIAARGFLDTLENTFGEGVTANIPITLTGVVDYRSQIAGDKKITGTKTDHYATGGLIRNPTLSWFAEDSPEMAIPIDGSNRSISLWEETGRMLGAYDQNNYSKTLDSMAQGMSVVNSGSGSGGTVAPVYAPVMNFYGNTSREEVEAAGMTRYEQFEEWIERYDHYNSRISLRDH